MAGIGRGNRVAQWARATPLTVLPSVNDQFMRGVGRFGGQPGPRHSSSLSSLRTAPCADSMDNQAPPDTRPIQNICRAACHAAHPEVWGSAFASPHTSLC
ncbi:hypothetical protein GCM10009799_00120 [Nocardiopsis rhodophaea]|uniref:Uncharacterized protein n=1 Tax=Nocardiopsis rhodophaea TaxID=280238 RepID=A0ABN2S2H1_9ACTN